jgi:hypothetical protein
MRTMAKSHKYIGYVIIKPYFVEVMCYFVYCAGALEYFPKTYPLNVIAVIKLH